MATKIVNPLNTSRLIDVTDAFNTVAYPYGAFSKTGLYTPDYLNTTTAIAQVDQNGLGKMTGFTSREERNGFRTAKKRNKAIALAIPHIKIEESITYEDFAGRIASWDGLTAVAQEATVQDATLDRLDRMSLAMTQNIEYLALSASRGVMLNPEDGEEHTNMFDILGYDKVTETLDLTSQTLDVLAWSVKLKESLQKRNRVSPVIPTVDILVNSADMQAIQSHPSLSVLRANLLVGGGLAGLGVASKLLYSQTVLTDNGVGQVFDLGNGVRFITYPASFTRYDGTVVEATTQGTAHTILRGVSGLYRVAYAPAPYFSQLGSVGSEVYAWRTPITNDQQFNVGIESSPLFYMSQPDLAVEIKIKTSTSSTGTGTGVQDL